MNELFSDFRKAITFPTDYTSIIDRIDKIDPIQYGRTRNYIDGAVTYLSPYVSRGVISVYQIQQAVLAKGYQSPVIEKFLQELAWREYFQRVWQAKGDDLFQDIKQPQPDVRHYQMIEAVVNAHTGIRAIDNLITEFYETGYLHNHVRMYIASITCNIGRAHWLMPSRWMYAHLLDGDLASNSCSWQWVAGAFAFKKYYCNQENINLYTHSDQQNTFLDNTVESLATVSVPFSLEATMQWHLEAELPSRQVPIIDKTKPTLIYNSYNLDPLWRKDEDVNRVLLLEPSHFQKFPVSEKVLKFILELSGNITHIQVMVGEVSELAELCKDISSKGNHLISREHPAFQHYPGLKDERDWIYPKVKGYFSSFFSFWKQCKRSVISR